MWICGYVCELSTGCPQGCSQGVDKVVHRGVWIRLSTGLSTGCGLCVVGGFGWQWWHLSCWCFCASTIYHLTFLRLSQSVLRCSQNEPHTTNTHTFTPAFAGRMRNNSAGHIHRDLDANKKNGERVRLLARPTPRSGVGLFPTRRTHAPLGVSMGSRP